MKKHSNAPIFDTLHNRVKRRNNISFHTPGHKYGRSIDKKLKAYTGSNVYKFDVTVFPEVDSLHDPTSSIKKAQILMANAYDVPHSFFLVNGSSVGNMAMLLSACKPGDSVIVSRNAHKSIMSGIILAGLWPIWLQPKIDQNLDIIFNSSAQQIEEALNKYPEAKAVFITSPTYNGVVTDLKRISELCHDNDVPLLVDEAHGAHLMFHDKFPVSAVEAEADLCVQSTHKTLSALSQGSVLHYNSKLIDFNRVKKVVSLLQTTSPNYLTLASIDLARRQAMLHGKEMFTKIIRTAEYARRQINHMEKFTCFTKAEIQKHKYWLDPTKLTINVTRTGFSGQYIADILAKEYNIQVDCADIFNLIAIMGAGSRKSDVLALVDALYEIEEKYEGGQENWILQLPSLSTEMVLMPRDVLLAHKSKRVSLTKAAGHISAQTLTPYPPGIPVLIPGERITKEICDYIMDLSSKDIRVSGQETDTLRTIKVVSE